MVAILTGVLTSGSQSTWFLLVGSEGGDLLL